MVAINRAVLWLDGQFEGGNLESYNVGQMEGSRVELEVSLRGDSN